MHGASPALAARIVAAMARRVSSLESVGRDDALDLLAAAMFSVRDGQPRHVLVIGEAGAHACDIRHELGFGWGIGAAGVALTQGLVEV